MECGYRSRTTATSDSVRVLCARYRYWHFSLVAPHYIFYVDVHPRVAKEDADDVRVLSACRIVKKTSPAALLNLRGKQRKVNSCA